MFKLFLFLVFSLTTSFSYAQMYSSPSGGWACITELGGELAQLEDGSEYVAYSELLSENSSYGFMTVGNGLSCKFVKEAQNKWLGMTIALSSGALLSSCTGIGAPISLIFTAGAITTNYIRMRVGDLPCKDKSEEEIKQYIKQLSCEAVENQGITCNPHELEEQYEDHWFI